MNKVFRNALLVAAGVGLLSIAACKVETETYYKGTPFAQSVDWSSGQSLNVYNVNGDLTVKVGTTEQVVVNVQPFTRANSDSDAKTEMEQKEAISVTAADSSNPVRVLASTSGASGYTGYDLVIVIPPDFNSSIQLVQKNGTLKVVGVANSTSANVKIDNGPLTADLGNAEITAYSGNGDVAVWVGGTAGGTVTTDNGSIDFYIPSAANANVSGWAKDGGHLSVAPSVPSTWQENASSSSAKTWKCNSGSTETYALTAQGTSLSDVVIHAE